MTFDPKTHTYTLNGEILPSVSQIANQGAKFYGNAKEAMDRGTRIHEATAYLDSLGLSILDVDDDIHGYVRAWQNFLLRTNAKVKLVETLLWSEQHKFAGTMDRFLEIEGKGYVVDLKSGSPANWHPWQLAGYSIALAERQPELQIDGGIVVYVKESGKCTQKTFDGPAWDTAHETFMALLATYKEKTK